MTSRAVFGRCVGEVLRFLLKNLRDSDMMVTDIYQEDNFVRLEDETYEKICEDAEKDEKVICSCFGDLHRIIADGLRRKRVGSTCGIRGGV